MGIIEDLQGLGQSVWLDFISRELLDSGELAKYVEMDEVRGVTSNPSIFEAAIAKTNQYTDAIGKAFGEGRSPEEVLDALILKDICDAADVFLPLYQRTNGADGFVSVEVDPELAHDAEGTLREARRLWKAVDRPNIMIKIPATEIGLSAISGAIADGINVNVTLIFSLERYGQVMEAYLSGLEQRLENGRSVDHIASVASFFVSRIDTAVDNALLEIESQNANSDVTTLLGKAAIASGKLAYQKFKEVFNTKRFEKLARQGAAYQRPLWASTSTKNPEYPDTYYVDHLIGPNTVNTLPPKTFEAFKDHGTVERTIDRDLEDAYAALQKVEDLGISLTRVTDQLEREGVDKFAQSFRNLLQTVRMQSPSSSNS
jgi:transaldolase/glucose-6-phosphate isomerase